MKEYTKPEIAELIPHPNSCTQGHCSLYAGHPLTTVIKSYGYVYSHSTPVGLASGGYALHHTFQFPGREDRCGVWEGSLSWDTCITPGSGHKHYGTGIPALIKHLKGKRSRGCK